MSGTASALYTLPPFFANTKVINYSTYIPHRNQSPDYELLSTFDLLRICLGCTSARDFKNKGFQVQEGISPKQETEETVLSACSFIETDVGYIQYTSKLT
ncbi:hypothetical protein RUM44_013124 [Polyplax serrata]|uniref:Uncharacterized protein n=1 Tax=Polyplax serrata TaxID=468196 RepID=A0ABR1BDA0_POLSC